jgi:hypothetical protein
MPELENEDYLLDDTPVKFTISCCNLCVHFDGKEKATCKAFPNGIPDKFSIHCQKHTQIEKGQSGNFIWEYKRK